MVSKRALELGHIRFGQEVNMAEVVEVENAETQDCEFISEKMSEAQRKDLCKELEKHPCLWETCGPEYKNKPRRSRALDELCQKFNISPSCLKKQLHSLRTALTREVKKETTEGQQAILFANKKTHCRPITTHDFLKEPQLATSKFVV